MESLIFWRWSDGSWLKLFWSMLSRLFWAVYLTMLPNLRATIGWSPLPDFSATRLEALFCDLVMARVAFWFASFWSSWAILRSVSKESSHFVYLLKQGVYLIATDESSLYLSKNCSYCLLYFLAYFLILLFLVAAFECTLLLSFLVWLKLSLYFCRQFQISWTWLRGMPLTRRTPVRLSRVWLVLKILTKFGI